MQVLFGRPFFTLRIVSSWQRISPSYGIQYEGCWITSNLVSNMKGVELPILFLITFLVLFCHFCILVLLFQLIADWSTRVCYKSSATCHYSIGPVIIHIIYKSPVISQSQNTTHFFYTSSQTLSSFLSPSKQIKITKISWIFKNILEHSSPNHHSNLHNKLFRPP